MNMSEHSNQNKNRETSLWGQYRSWVGGMDRKRRRRYRALQAAAIFLILSLLAWVALELWIRVPEIPNVGSGTGGEPGSSTSQSGVFFEGAELPEVAKSGRKEGTYTFLVAGRDVASGATDTMLLFRFDSKNKTLDAVSLPRDTMINTAAGSKRLNVVFARNRGSSKLTQAERAANGMAALKQEVSKLTGIYADFYVLVEWDAIGELVDALGGVEFEVPYLMDYTDPYQDLRIYQEPGLRVLSGDDAMQVIRWRKNNGPGSSLQVGDTGRMEIQQEFLKAVFQECLKPAALLKIPSLAQAFLDNVNTDLTIGNLLAFAQLAVGIDLKTDIRFETVPNVGTSYKGASMLLLQEEALLKLLNERMNPYLAEIQASDLQLLYKKSDGSYGVTHGELADAALGEVPVVNKPEPEQPTEELPMEGTEMPPEAPEADEPSEEEPEDSGLSDLPEVLDPDVILPDPNEDMEEPAEEPLAPAA